MNKRVNSKNVNQQDSQNDLDAFLTKNSSLFEIQKEDYIDIINKCKRRDAKAKENDIAFILKLKKGETALIVGQDKVFKLNVQKSEARLQRMQENIAKDEERMTKMRQKECERKERECKTVELDSSEEEDNIEDKDEKQDYNKDDLEKDKDFELSSYAKRQEESQEKKRNNSGKLKSDTKVCLTLSLDDIIQEWNPFVTRKVSFQ